MACLRATKLECEVVEVSQLIDLTDKPISLTRDEIGWANVRSNASNCICCCCNNSITLVTTDDSYILDHVPLDNIQHAQTNPSLQYLALSNERKLVIVDLVGSDINCAGYTIGDASADLATSSANSETKMVNLASHGLTMNDIVFWRWLDDSTLAILSYESLYTCSIDQQHIYHPAQSALSHRSRALGMQKVLDIHQHLSTLCQVTDIQRDHTGNYYAISSLYSTSSILKMNANPTAASNPPAAAAQNSHHHNHHLPRATLKPSFGSMPSKLSQLAANEQMLDSLRSDHRRPDIQRSQTNLQQEPKRQTQQHQQVSPASDDEICGLIQVHCLARNRSQLLQAHVITFTHSPSSGGEGPEQAGDDHEPPTILIAANKIDNKMRVHFVEMADPNAPDLPPGQNFTLTHNFDFMSSIDFPSSIVCSHVNTADHSDVRKVAGLHVALISTKYGQLFVCSVAHSTVLFNIRITEDLISSTVLESKSQGLMVICRNGRVLLVRLNLDRLMKLLDDSKTLRHITSTNNLIGSMNGRGKLHSAPIREQVSETSQTGDSFDSEMDDVLISTKL